MEEAPRKTKPEEESSPTEDGSPLAPEPKRRRISGEEDDGGGAGGGGGAEEEEEEEDTQWEDTATNASSKKEMEQILKATNRLVDQLEAKIGADTDIKKLISGIRNGIRTALNDVSQMTDKIDDDAACTD
ncbi:uncharacterized protein LOC109715147 isoform X2 [Ananas comosus]|uniref:Uncharacterized protein LOC109715147 isoform X2 n=1 Tax=Ananas comosus TaxID=4615 RepID=A0A6P5FIX1_ANACO|nr:uncharacterized protein LOC109715147 isoform X2 [Ananas comosus]